MIGKTIEGFRIVTELGSGPTGEVWLVERVSGEGRAAIKLLRADLCSHRERLAEVVSAIRTLEELGHPNVARIEKVGEHGDRTFLITELLEGETLEAKLERGERLPPGEVGRVGSRIADAVHAAHEAGNHLHRGIKPQNVFVGGDPAEREAVKVTDFGVDLLLAESEPTVNAVRYAAPEVCRGDEAVDHRADIYSLGALLYHLATGAPPFVGEDADRLVLAHTTEQPVPPAERQPDVPGWLDAILQRALAKDVEARFASMAAMADALQQQGGTVDEDVDEEVDDGEASDAEEPAGDASAVEEPAGEASAAEEPAGDASAVEEPAGEASAVEEPAALQDDGAEPGKLQVFDSEPPPLQERQRAVVDKLSRAIVQRVVSGSLELPPPPEGVTAFTRLVTETASEIDAAEVLESDEELKALLEDRWDGALAVAKLARGLAHESGTEVDPRLAYLAALVLEAGRPLIAKAIPMVESKLKEPDASYVDDTVRAQVTELCRREVAVSLAYSWGLPPAIPQALPAVGSPSPDPPKSMQNVLTLALALASQAGLYPGDPSTEKLADHIERSRELLEIDQATTQRLLDDLRHR